MAINYMIKKRRGDWQVKWLIMLGVMNLRRPTSILLSNAAKIKQTNKQAFAVDYIAFPWVDIKTKCIPSYLLDVYLTYFCFNIIFILMRLPRVMCDKVYKWCSESHRESYGRP